MYVCVCVCVCVCVRERERERVRERERQRETSRTLQCQSGLICSDFELAKKIHHFIIVYKSESTDCSICQKTVVPTHTKRKGQKKETTEIQWKFRTKTYLALGYVPPSGQGHLKMNHTFKILLHQFKT